jgi:hypothetical protein
VLAIYLLFGACYLEFLQIPQSLPARSRFGEGRRIPKSAIRIPQ